MFSLFGRDGGREGGRDEGRLRCGSAAVGNLTEQDRLGVAALFSGSVSEFEVPV